MEDTVKSQHNKRNIRRESAAARFEIKPFYDWAAEHHGGVGSVPDNHEELYMEYLERKYQEVEALGLGDHFPRN
jgi:hypothetical protein